VAGHKGYPEIARKLGRKGRRRRLKGQRGRGILDLVKPPLFGLFQRNGEVSIQMLPDVQRATIHLILTSVMQSGSLVYTDEYDIYLGALVFLSCVCWFTASTFGRRPPLGCPPCRRRALGRSDAMRR
jgi:ISXO2-like transposase domain